VEGRHWLRKAVAGNIACHTASDCLGRGFTLRKPDGAKQTIAFDIADGRIAAIYIVLNPDKLQRLAVSPLT